MLTPQATIAEASARAGLHTARTLLVRGFTRARAGQVTKSLEDLTAVHADSDARLTDLERAALLTTGIDCRLARGELALALSLGEELDPLLEVSGLAGATAHYGRGDLAAATGERAGRRPLRPARAG